MSKDIVLNDGQSGYDVVGDYVRDHWHKTYYSTAIVLLATSYDGKEYNKSNDVVSPFSDHYDSDSMEFLHDWWEGEKYIKIFGIINIDDIDAGYRKASEVVRDIFNDLNEMWHKGRGFIKYPDLVRLERLHEQKYTEGGE